MFSNDLLQNQLSLGAYSGAMNPLTSSYAGPYAGSMQTGINPLGNPFAGLTQNVSPFGQQGYGGAQNVSPFGQQVYGGAPNYAAAIAQQQIQDQIRQLQQIQQIQQLQALAAILASQGANQQVFGPSQQNNPFQNNPWQSQQQPNLLQNPLIAASLQNPLLAQQLQQQNPFAQSGFQLAPQSWVGQQINPHHHQLAGRGIY